MAAFVRTRLISVRLTNFKSYEDYLFNLMGTDGNVKRMVGLFGPNGSGKSTMQDAIGLLFRNFAGYDRQRLATSLQRYVRNVDNPDVAGEVASELPDSDSSMVIEAENIARDDFKSSATETWKVEGWFITENGDDYTVVVSNDPELYRWRPPSRPGLDATVAGLKHDHPPEVKVALPKQCFVTKYDQELQKFQLRKDRWLVFKKLFEAVTGFPVEKHDGEMSDEAKDRRENRHLACIDEFVLGLAIRKPHETISERQCSDGERKILKSFTTVLNKEVIPSIILIDNVEMHVEVDRHVSLVECIEQCFPDSQIIFTTHSPMIINEYPLDRLVSLANKKISPSETWRQEMLRILRGVKLVFRDSDFVGEAATLCLDLENEEFSDRSGAAFRLRTLLESGCKRVSEKLEKM